GGLIFAVVMGASYFVLFQNIATAQLTFEADDRSSGIRFICSVQFFLVWIGLLALAWLGSGPGPDEGLIITATLQSARPLGPAGSGRRLLQAPFLQGGARGYLYVLLHVGVFALLGVLMSMTYVGYSNWSSLVPLAIAAYLVIYLGLAAALSRGLQRMSSEIKPGHTRVLFIILLAIGCIAPHIPLLWINQFRYSYSILQISEPFS